VVPEPAEIKLSPSGGKSSASLEITVEEVERALDSISLAVLGILVTIGVTVGFGLSVRAAGERSWAPVAR
jgi:hypothetical protein